MTFQTLQGGLVFPNFPPVLATVVVASLAEAADRVGFIFRAPKTGTIDQFELHGDPVVMNAASRIRFSFQNVSAGDGFPDGVQDQFRDVAATDFGALEGWKKPHKALTSDGTDTGSKRSVTRGDVLAGVLQFQIFTAGDQFDVYGIAPALPNLAFPYMAHLDFSVSASWVMNVNAPLFGVRYSDGSTPVVAPLIVPDIHIAATVSIDTGTTPDEVGIRFRLPFPVKVGALWGVITNLSGAGDFDLKLYSIPNFRNN
ncbi:hypothetical protein LCGC14_2671420 [marine sediment metagenome]|uniref:Uncharacterized protein n=1 Tax=marine sediment metagenome TaxID=412755 RepID=A0A0F9CFX8_9ZZZZ